MTLLRNLSSKVTGRPIRVFAFFIFFYLYLYFVVDLRLIYHGGGLIVNFPNFFFGWDFLSDFISRPGGPMEYVSYFLAQFFFIRWAGALLVTAQAFLIFMFVDQYLKAISAYWFSWLSYVVVLLLLAAYNLYTYHFTTTTAFLLAMVFVYLYLKLGSQDIFVRALLFAVLSIVFYYLAGGAFFVFAVLCGFYELFFTIRGKTGFLYLLFAAVIPYVIGVVVFGVTIRHAYDELLPISWKTLFSDHQKASLIIIYVFFLLIPVFTALLGFWRLLGLTRFLLNRQIWLFAKVIGFRTKFPLAVWLTNLLILIAVTAGASFWSHDARKKNILQADYYGCHRNWSEVLRCADRSTGNYLIINAANRALYHTDRLGYDMFKYKQDPHTLMFTVKKQLLTGLNRIEILADMGMINLFENRMILAMEIFGERPYILKALARANMGKGNLGIAKIYLKALSKTLFYSSWAKNYLTKIDVDPDLSQDSAIQELRSLVPKLESDYGSLGFPNEKIFLYLLESNSGNKMAFEYLMSHYLLTANINKFVQNIYRLDDFDYSENPPLYEQAILLYERITKNKVNIGDRTISEQTRWLFADFTRILFGKYNGDKGAAYNELAANYGGTFLFYYIYGQSGIGK